MLPRCLLMLCLISPSLVASEQFVAVYQVDDLLPATGEQASTPDLFAAPSQAQGPALHALIRELFDQPIRDSLIASSEQTGEGAWVVRADDQEHATISAALTLRRTQLTTTLRCMRMPVASWEHCLKQLPHAPPAGQTTERILRAHAAALLAHCATDPQVEMSDPVALTAVNGDTVTYANVRTISYPVGQSDNTPATTASCTIGDTWTACTRLNQDDTILVSLDHSNTSLAAAEAAIISQDLALTQAPRVSQRSRSLTLLLRDNHAALEWRTDGDHVMLTIVSAGLSEHGTSLERPAPAASDF